MKINSFRFVVISGFGWIVDISTMTIIVHFGGEPAISNFCSALLAITFVYWLSRMFVFEKKMEKRAFTGYVFYSLYSLVVIVLFSMLIQYISYFLFHFHSYFFSLTTSAFIAKIIVTPFNLYVNFVVSKFIAGKT